MSSPVRQALTIARRDFLSIVATPTFLIFLLAPLFMLSFGLIGGLGAQGLESRSGNDTVVAVVSREDGALLAEASVRIHNGNEDQSGLYDLTVVEAGPRPEGQARDIAAKSEDNVYSVLYGPVETPVILEKNAAGLSGRYLASIADLAAQAKRDGAFPDLVRPVYKPLGSAASRKDTRKAIGFGAVFVIFMLTLLTAGQTVSTLAEEKGNKVIEILAAAAPLEAVFVGKLVAMLGVAILFIGFWLLIGFGGSLFAVMHFADQAATAAASAPMSATDFNLADFAPAIGFPAFIGFAVLYFLMSFLLLGSLFLGIGALASTMREIQMLSLPITIFQVAMFGLAGAAANSPGETVATIAQIVPFSSPLAMAARGATDPAVWPHFAALAWQGLWVALVIWLSVRLFRFGVLKSGGRGGVGALWRRMRRGEAG